MEADKVCVNVNENVCAGVRAYEEESACVMRPGS